MKRLSLLVCILFFLPALFAQEKEKLDLETIARIRYEGFHDSKVMDFATGLMDSIGESLTDDDLAKLGQYEIPSERPPFRFADLRKRRQFMKELDQFLVEEKVLAIVDHSRGTAGGGTVYVQAGGSS